MRKQDSCITSLRFPLTLLALVVACSLGGCVFEHMSCKEGSAWEDPDDPDNFNCEKISNANNTDTNPDTDEGNGAGCVAACDGISCGGDDGCGGTCGCAAGLDCVAGYCAKICDCTGKSCDEDDGCGNSCGPCALHPQDGNWSGNGIKFTVSGGGTHIDISSADYGSCSNGGCSTSSSTSCGSCDSSIKNKSGSATFSDSSMGCKGTFTSATTASGTCSTYSDGCGCSMSHSWTASP